MMESGTLGRRFCHFSMTTDGIDLSFAISGYLRLNFLSQVPSDERVFFHQTLISNHSFLCLPIAYWGYHLRHSQGTHETTREYFSRTSADSDSLLSATYNELGPRTESVSYICVLYSRIATPFINGIGESTY